MNTVEIKNLWDQADDNGVKAKDYAETENALRWQVAEAIAAKLAEKDENGKRVISQRDLARELGRSLIHIQRHKAVWDQFGSDSTGVSFSACMTKVREPKPKPPVNEVRPAPQTDHPEPQAPIAPLPNGNEAFIEPGQETDPTKAPLSGALAQMTVGYKVEQALIGIRTIVAEVIDSTAGVTIDDTQRKVFVEMISDQIENLEMLRASFEAGSITDVSDILGNN